MNETRPMSDHRAGFCLLFFGEFQTVGNRAGKWTELALYFFACRTAAL